jgi:hypothetical protein
MRTMDFFGDRSSVRKNGEKLRHLSGNFPQKMVAGVKLVGGSQLDGVTQGIQEVTSKFNPTSPLRSRRYKSRLNCSTRNIAKNEQDKSIRARAMFE